MKGHRARPPASAALTARASAGHNLCLRLRAAYLTVHRRANLVFAGFNVTADQFVLLTALTEESGMTQKELARRANSDPNTISEMVARLERRGLLTREPHAGDGRALFVSLTEAGREVQRRAAAGAAPLNESIANLVGLEGLDGLLAHLDRIVGGLTDAERRPGSEAAEATAAPATEVA